MNLTPEERRLVECRFWERVDRRGSGECWRWKGAPSGFGYGVLFVRGKNRYAHRLSYSLAHGPIPRGLFVLHRCDNPICVNPAHLFLGTPHDNNIDMAAKGRSTHGEKNRHAKLTRDDVRWMRWARVYSGATQRRIGAFFGVDQSTVCYAVNGSTWRNL